MEYTNKHLAVAAIAGMLIGGLLTKFGTTPDIKVIETEKVVLQEKVNLVEVVKQVVVEKVVEKKIYVSNTNKSTYKKTTIGADGSTTIIESTNLDRMVQDTRVEKVETEKVVEKDKVVKVEVDHIVEKVKTIEPVVPNWRLDVGLGYGLDLQPTWAVGVSRRILGPVRIGLRYESDVKLMTALELEF
jgi:hypothetical protein